MAANYFNAMMRTGGRRRRGGDVSDEEKVAAILAALGSLGSNVGQAMAAIQGANRQEEYLNLQKKRLGFEEEAAARREKDFDTEQKANAMIAALFRMDDVSKGERADALFENFPDADPSALISAYQKLTSGKKEYTIKTPEAIKDIKKTKGVKLGYLSEKVKSGEATPEEKALYEQEKYDIASKLLMAIEADPKIQEAISNLSTDNASEQINKIDTMVSKHLSKVSEPKYEEVVDMVRNMGTESVLQLEKDVFLETPVVEGGETYNKMAFDYYRSNPSGQNIMGLLNFRGGKLDRKKIQKELEKSVYSQLLFQDYADDPERMRKMGEYFERYGSRENLPEWAPSVKGYLGYKGESPHTGPYVTEQGDIMFRDFKTLRERDFKVGDPDKRSERMSRRWSTPLSAPSEYTVENPLPLPGKLASIYKGISQFANKHEIDLSETKEGKKFLKEIEEGRIYPHYRWGRYTEREKPPAASLFKRDEGPGAVKQGAPIPVQEAYRELLPYQEKVLERNLVPLVNALQREVEKRKKEQELLQQGSR